MRKKNVLLPTTTKRQRVEVENEIESETAKFRKCILNIYFRSVYNMLPRTNAFTFADLYTCVWECVYFSVKCWMWKWSHTNVHAHCGVFSHRHTLNYADYFILCFVVLLLLLLLCFFYRFHYTSISCVYVPVLMLFTFFPPSFSIACLLVYTQVVRLFHRLLYWRFHWKWNLLQMRLDKAKSKKRTQKKYGIIEMKTWKCGFWSHRANTLTRIRERYSITLATAHLNRAYVVERSQRLVSYKRDVRYRLE